MKKSIAIFFVFVVATAAYAQNNCNGSSTWSTAGGTMTETCGNLGVGVAAPTTRLQVYQSGVDGTQIKIQHDASPGALNGGLVWGTAATNTNFIKSRQHDVTSYGIDFGTYLDGNVGVTTKMSILGSGNVGIGTTTPATLLDVNTGIVTIGGTAGTSSVDFGSGNRLQLELHNPTTGLSIIRSYNRAIGSYGDIGLSENFRFIIKGDTGNVGIGNAAPASDIKLDVGGAIRASTFLKTDHINSNTTNLLLDTPANAYNITFGNNYMVVKSGGHVGIGDPNPAQALSVTGNVHATGDITADGNISAKYQDIAEWVPASADLQPGTVVVLDPAASNKVMASTKAYDTSVAGVVSPQPGVILGRESENKAKIATLGRVRIRVDATRRPVHVGDLLVTGDKPGMAMVSEPVDVAGIKMHRPGTLIGKALEPLPSGEGEVLVLLSLQ